MIDSFECQPIRAFASCCIVLLFVSARAVGGQAAERTAPRLGQMPFNVAIFDHDGIRLFTGARGITLWDLQTGEQVRRFEGHTEIIHGLSISPDGRSLASGAGRHWFMGFLPGNMPMDTTARVWGVATGRELHIFRGHSSYVDTVIFSDDGKRLLTAARDNRAIMWDLQGEKPIWTLDVENDSATDPDVKLNGTRRLILAVAGANHAMQICDARSGKLRFSLERGEGIHFFRTASFTSDGTVVATGCSCGRIILWETDGGRRLGELDGHRAEVTGLVYSADGQLVVSASSDATAILWDVVRRAPIRRFEHCGPVNGVTISEDGNRVLTNWSIPFGPALDPGPKYYASLWDRSNGDEIQQFSLGGDAGGPVAILSPDGTKIFTNSQRPTLWDAQTGDMIRQFD